MRKIKQTTILLISYLVGLAILAEPVSAVVVVDIVDLPEYITTNNFKLSCTALGGSPAQFSFKKEGGSYTDFGPVIDLTITPCQVLVTSTQIDEQTKYYFKVTVDGVSDETSTFYDISGPSPVSNYYKDQAGTGFYKLHWKNPGDSDFSKVIIYRGETADFSADGSHSIAEVAGGANSDMTYDEHPPDPNKTFFYALRALDKAGNSSSLVGDAGTTVLGTSTQATAVPGTSSKVVSLPKEETQGEVLPESTVAPEEVSEEPKGVIGEVVQFAKNRTKLTVLIIAAIGLAGYLLYRKARKS